MLTLLDPCLNSGGLLTVHCVCALFAKIFDVVLVNYNMLSVTYCSCAQNRLEGQSGEERPRKRTKTRAIPSKIHFQAAMSGQQF
jgi:hypothetical protein